MGVELSCCTSTPLHPASSSAPEPLNPLPQCGSCRLISRLLAETLSTHDEYLSTAPPTLMTKSGCRTPMPDQSPERRSISGNVTPRSWISRRPEESAILSCVTHNDETAINTSFCSSSTSKKFDVAVFAHTPPKWFLTQPQRYSLVRLKCDGKKFKEIQKKVARSLPLALERVERVQNRDLYRTFLESNQRLSYKVGKALNLSELFYGTGRIDPYRLCAEQGLDSECVQVFPRPLTCFLEEAKACWKFAYCTRDGHLQLLLCLVAIGETAEMERGEDLTEPCHSKEVAVKMRKGKSWIWVVYETGRSYPAYVLTFSQNKSRQSAC